MEIYSTEEQQVEAIKKFIKENGLAVVLGVIVGGAGIFGWRYYSAEQLLKQEQASDVYEKVVKAVNEESTDINQVIDSLQQEQKDSAYAVLAAFIQAKNAVDKEDWVQADQQLNWAIDHAPHPSIRAIALIRLTRVQLQQQQYTEALQTLARDLPEAFAAQIAELKGDIYFAQQEFSKAKESYLLAIEKGGTTSNQTLQYKADNLTETTPDA